MRKWRRRPRYQGHHGSKLRSSAKITTDGARRYMRRINAAILAGTILLAFTQSAKAQQEFFTREDVIKYTPDWHGERLPDGRPKVPDDILDRMKNVTLEEAWATLRGAGFVHQYED